MAFFLVVFAVNKANCINRMDNFKAQKVLLLIAILQQINAIPLINKPAYCEK